MSSPRQSTTALLAALTESNDQRIWGELDARYRPVLVAFATRLGLIAADAEDAAQETLMRLVADYQAGKFDRARGRVRAWILSIARYRIADVQRRNGKQIPSQSHSMLHNIAESDQLEALWEAEWHRAMVGQALAQLRAESRFSETTIQAFERLVLDQQSVADVARELGMTPNDVYVVKHRCLDRLHRIMAALNDMDEGRDP